MSDFERSGERAGVTYDEPARRRNAGTWFADLGDRLARGFNNFDRPQLEEPEWDDSYEEVEQPTQAAESVPDIQASRRRFPTSKHGYDCDAVDEHVDGLEQEIAQLAAQLSSAKRSPSSAVEAELERVGAETSAILKVAHEQASEITRRAQIQADRCIADAAANAVSMTEDANRRLRQLDTETDAVWAERIRLIEDVRNVATSLFSLAEDASERFPEDADRGGATVAAAAVMPGPKAAARPGAATPMATPIAPKPVPAVKPVEDEGEDDGEGSSPDSPGFPTGG
jgi:cell division septum initiation protein DivIVA